MDGHDASAIPPTAASALSSNLPVPSHPLKWLPEFWSLGASGFGRRAE